MQSIKCWKKNTYNCSQSSSEAPSFNL